MHFICSALLLPAMAVVLLLVSRSDAKPEDAAKEKKIAEIQKEIADLQARIAKLQAELAKLKPSDPEALLKPLLAKMATEGTEARVTDFVAPGQWTKRKYLALADSIKLELKKTGLPMAPYSARVTWRADIYQTGRTPTKDRAEKADFLGPTKTDFQWWAELVFSDGKWVIQDVGWMARPGSAIQRKHSLVKNDQDPVKDWWYFFGGK